MLTLEACAIVNLCISVILLMGACVYLLEELHRERARQRRLIATARYFLEEGDKAVKKLELAEAELRAMKGEE